MGENHPARVLIIDSDDRAAAEYARFFDGMDWSVTRAKSWQEAIEFANRMSFSYAIFDLTLPDELGPEAWNQLKDKQPGIYGIMTTESRSLHDNIKIDDERIVGYLLKPVVPEDFSRLMPWRIEGGN